MSRKVPRQESLHDGQSDGVDPAGLDDSPDETAGARKQNLLEEIERRQDEVIAELDALNDRIEGLLRDWNRREEAAAKAA